VGVMATVILERNFDLSMTPREVLDMARAEEAGGCFRLHKVVWRMSFLAPHGRQMVCWFEAPDAESARIALRTVGADVTQLWAGKVHDAPDLDPAAFAGVNVLVERSFAAPTPVERIQALEDEAAGCLELHGVRFLRTFASLDHRRMLCLYRAPDSESVRLAQRAAGVPMDRAWAVQRIAPPD
jgi:hypothetical protein